MYYVLRHLHDVRMSDSKTRDRRLRRRAAAAEVSDVGCPYVTLSISLPLGLIKGLPCAQLPSLGGTGPRVWDLGKLISMAMAEVLVVKLKDKKKKAKVAR